MGEKNKFSTRLPLPVRSLFCLSQKFTNNIFAWYVIVRTGKSQTGGVKLNISASEGEVKSTRLGFTVSVTETQEN